VGKAVSRDYPSIRDEWAVWVENVRSAAALLAPIELARAFFLDQKYFRRNYEGRRDLIERMRSIDPPP
jgi:hypothetical protein